MLLVEVQSLPGEVAEVQIDAVGQEEEGRVFVVVDFEVRSQHENRPVSDQAFVECAAQFTEHDIVEVHRALSALRVLDVEVDQIAERPADCDVTLRRRRHADPESFNGEVVKVEGLLVLILIRGNSDRVLITKTVQADVAEGHPCGVIDLQPDVPDIPAGQTVKRRV